jgi:hypothetical protein
MEANKGVRSDAFSTWYLVRQVLVKDWNLQGKMPIDSVEIGTAQIKAALWAAQFAANLLQFLRAVGTEA